MPEKTEKGALWVTSKITKPDAITPANYDKWYEKHIQDIFSVGNLTSAYRYINIDPSADHPYFALYPASDVESLTVDELKKFPMTSELFPGSGSAFDFVDFDTRFYEFVHGFEKEGATAGPAKLMISAALTPAAGTDDDFDTWYRNEHIPEVSQCTGYVRTRRYKLKQALAANYAPAYLALHEFDSDTVPAEELAKTTETEWAKKVMGSLAAQEILVFKFDKAFGAADARV